MMRLFDPHTHLDTRNCTDYELLALAHVERVVVPCSPTHERKYCREAFAERFDKLIEFERKRAAAFGIELDVALAVNGGDIGDAKSALGGLDEVELRLSRPCVVAIGELSLRAFNDVEIDVFVRQLALAGAAHVPVIVEAPPAMDAFEQLVTVLAHALDDGVVDSRSVFMVDLNEEKLRRARDLDLGAYGLPVSPPFEGPFGLREKLDHERVLRVVETFGPERILLNSGLHCGFADPLCFPKTALRLALAGMRDETLRAVVHDNAALFFQDAH